MERERRWRRRALCRRYRRIADPSRGPWAKAAIPFRRPRRQL